MFPVPRIAALTFLLSPMRIPISPRTSGEADRARFLLAKSILPRLGG
jgi:hypothetical protein